MTCFHAAEGRALFSLRTRPRCWRARRLTSEHGLPIQGSSDRRHLRPVVRRTMSCRSEMRNPAHVPLNSLYAVLEAEARIAILSIGLIPGQACCIPTDLKGRDSLVLAAWSHFLEGRDENGDPTPINDRRATELIAAAQAEHVAPGSFLDYRPSSATSEPTRACARHSLPAARRWSITGHGPQSRRSPTSERRCPLRWQP
jgi:hypothetical protein